MPLGGDSEKKGEHMDRALPWGISSKNHRLGTPGMGSYREEEPPWLLGGLLGLTGGLWEAWALLMGSTHTLACPGGRAERGVRGLL